MTDEERRAWLRTLAVLAIVAALRWGWSHRSGPDGGPGVERDVTAAIDTVQALQAEEERRTRPLEPDETLDPNHADEIELDRLPGVGPATAAAIVDARTRVPFSTAEDLLSVRGIGPATLAKLRAHVRIPPGGARRASGRGSGPPSATASPGPTTVEINSADAAELETLPGIGPALASRIVRDRAASGRYAHVDELLRVSGIGPVTLDRLRPLVTVR